MTTKVFKIGDRVAADWYNPSDHTYTRVKGWYAGTRGPNVVAVSEESGEEYPAWLCSKNSMRRLKPKVKKEPIRIFLRRDICDFSDYRVINRAISNYRTNADDIEFIEVIDTQKAE